MRHFFSAVILLLPLLLELSAVSFAETPEKCVDIAHGHNPVIAGDGEEHIHVVFESSAKDHKVQHIFHTQSADGGRIWTAPQDISSSQGASWEPDIATEASGAIDVCWVDTASGEAHPDVFFARSADRGKSWSAPVNVSKTPGVSSEPAIAVGPDKAVHVVWTDTTNGVTDIFYSRSSDNGKSWSQFMDIAKTPGKSHEPATVVSASGTVHVAWVDTSFGESHPDIFYSRYLEGRWTKPYNVSKSAHVSQHPTLACSHDDKIYLAWADSSRKLHAPDIWGVVSGERGYFAKPLNFSDTPGVSSQPQIASDGKARLALVWSDTSLGGMEIFGRIGIKGGFSSVLNFSHTKEKSHSPDVALIGNLVYVAWEADAANEHIIKITSCSADVPTGPVFAVDPEIHAHNSR